MKLSIVVSALSCTSSNEIAERYFAVTVCDFKFVDYFEYSSKSFYFNQIILFNKLKRAFRKDEVRPMIFHTVISFSLGNYVDCIGTTMFSALRLVNKLSVNQVYCGI